MPFDETQPTQRNFLGQTAASGCEGFPTFQEIIPSSSSGHAGGLVASKLMTSVWVLPKLHILMRLSARETFIEFCHRESLRLIQPIQLIKCCQ